MVVVVAQVATGVETCGGDAVVDPAVALAAARGVGGPGVPRQRSTAAIAAAVTRVSNLSSAAFDGAVLVLADDVAGIVEVVVDTGEAAPSPSVTLALDCGAVTDVVGVV